MSSPTFRQTIHAATALALLLNAGQAAWALAVAQPQAATSTSAAAPQRIPSQAIIQLSADHGFTPAPANPFQPAGLDPATLAAAAKLTAAGLSPTYAATYLAAAHATGTPWQLLAAVHYAETRQAGSTNRRSYAGAIGPMQFLPATFQAYGLDGNHDGRTDITNLDDAMYAAGQYLSASGAGRGQYTAALLAYNHSATYAATVLTTARRLGL